MVLGEMHDFTTVSAGISAFTGFLACSGHGFASFRGNMIRTNKFHGRCRKSFDGNLGKVLLLATVIAKFRKGECTAIRGVETDRSKSR